MAPGRGRQRAQAQRGSSRQVSESSRQRRETPAPRRGPRGSSPNVRRSRRLSGRSSLEGDDSSRARVAQPLDATTGDLDSRSTQAEFARQRQRQQTREDRVDEDRNKQQHDDPASSADQPIASGMPEVVASANRSDEVRVQASQYELVIIVQPPGEATPGQVLAPPITARINDRESEEGSDNAAQVVDFYAVASLMDENGMTPLAPPSTDLLEGTPVAPVKVLSQEGSQTKNPENLESAFRADESVDAGISCVWFTDLTVTQKGRYRIRISLMSPVSPGAGVVTLQTVDSRIIHVRSDPSAGELSKEVEHDQKGSVR